MTKFNDKHQEASFGVQSVSKFVRLFLALR